MKKLSIIIPLLLILIGCTDTNKESINDNDKRNEHWCWFIDSNDGEGKWIKVKDQGNPVQNGHYTLFYSNGAIRERGTKEFGHNNDTSYYYSPFKYELVKYSFRIEDTDTITSRYIKEGRFKLYYPSMKVCEEGIVKNRRRSGIWKKYFDSGKLHMESGYDQGRPHGIHNVWNESGNLIERSYWKNGKADSIMILYYGNGSIKQKTNWNLGEKNGISEKWSENGTQIYSITYAEGEKNGAFKFYHDNGNISQSGTNKNNVPFGQLRFFREDGSLFQIDYYENGEIVRIEEF